MPTDNINTVFSGVNDALLSQDTIRETSVVLGSAIKENFRWGGRPERWLSSRRAQRQRTPEGIEGMTLVSTGRLMREVSQPQVQGNQIVFGSVLPYAAIHQFGFDGIVNVRPFTRRDESRSMYAIVTRRSRKTGREYTAMKKTAQGISFVKAHMRHMIMPARPYLYFPDETLKTVGEIIASRLQGAR